MTIRCKECHGTVSVQPREMESSSATVTCHRCGQTYSISAAGGLKSARKTLSRKARKLAREQGLDLPGAYSVLLDLMTVEQVRELGNAGSTSCRTSRDDDPNGKQRHNYDRDFQPAIEAGFLTPRQAAERGKREAYAGLLVTRHHLTRQTALAIADNRTSLLEAIREREREATRSGAGGRVANPMLGRGILVALLLAVAVVSVVWIAPELESRVVGEATRSYGDGTVRTDTRGRIVEAYGPSPKSVLAAFCSAADSYGRLEPVDVIPSPRPGVSGRLGIFRDEGNPERLLSIDIRQSRATNRWVAGDGRAELVPEEAPPGVQGRAAGH